eukprot:TRINITY_DN70333_c0_g1_i1.p1 TRINITY_DN70333_c0_g1~~TRINITY_DN70333_c0_g1_i1.p1  ORF type:complete len:253 (-),score=64.62 TRINITY_DN70333_c0_g1_i1:466-1224(-)
MRNEMVWSKYLQRLASADPSIAEVVVAIHCVTDKLCDWRDAEEIIKVLTAARRAQGHGEVQVTLVTPKKKKKQKSGHNYGTEAFNAVVKRLQARACGEEYVVDENSTTSQYQSPTHQQQPPPALRQAVSSNSKANDDWQSWKSSTNQRWRSRSRQQNGNASGGGAETAPAAAMTWRQHSGDDLQSRAWNGRETKQYWPGWYEKPAAAHRNGGTSGGGRETWSSYKEYREERPEISYSGGQQTWNRWEGWYGR